MIHDSFLLPVNFFLIFRKMNDTSIIDTFELQFQEYIYETVTPNNEQKSHFSGEKEIFNNIWILMSRSKI